MDAGAAGESVLNIGVLAPGSEGYYLSTVAAGVEDYYAGGEVPGRWTGRSAHLLGLEGKVDGIALSELLAGRDPTSGVGLGVGANRKVAAYDVTFSTPKSVSVLFGLGDAATSAMVRDAHEASVDAGLDYLERHAAWSRRGRNGVDQVPVDGFVAAAFRHRISRAGDPHLHTHVLVANTARGSDGAWRTLDFRHVYVHAKTAGYLYEANLRHLLTERLGVEWGPVRNGTAELAGVPTAVTRAFSTRRTEIEAVLAARGDTSARAAQVATLATRRPKDRDVDAVHLRDGWEATARAHGYNPDQLPELLHQTEPPSLTAERRERISDQLVGASGLTERATTFDRLAVLRAWCDQLPAGAPIIDIEELADRFLTDRDDVVRLAADMVTPLRGADGRRRTAILTGGRWSTKELLDLEGRQLRSVRARQHQHVGLVDEAILARALEARPTLSDDQARVVTHLCRSGHGVDVVTAPAGTGKTFTMAAARDAWEHAGHRVIGAALAARAAKELSATAHIPSTTLDALLIDLDRGAAHLDARTVVVVDEAGMVGTRKLGRLLDHAAQTSAKVVLVGDPRQLPEIAAGGLLARLATSPPTVTLTENRRQRAAWERTALRHLRDGEISRAICAYQDHGRIITGTNPHSLRQQLVDDWWTARTSGETVIMLAARRGDVDDLNQRARHHAAATGGLTGPVLTVDGTPYQAGDTVMTLRNDRRLDVRNGSRGTIEHVDPDARALTVTFTTGETRTIPARYLDAGHLTHAYAITVHKAQGLTCDRAFTLATDDLYQELGYVAMSRGRETNHLYAAASVFEPDDGRHPPTRPRAVDDLLLTGLTTSRAQHLATDYLPAAEATRYDLEPAEGIEHAPRRHQRQRDLGLDLGL